MIRLFLLLLFAVACSPEDSKKSEEPVEDKRVKALLLTEKLLKVQGVQSWLQELHQPRIFSGKKAVVWFCQQGRFRLLPPPEIPSCTEILEQLDPEFLKSYPLQCENNEVYLRKNQLCQDQVFLEGLLNSRFRGGQGLFVQGSAGSLVANKKRHSLLKNLESIRFVPEKLAEWKLPSRLEDWLSQINPSGPLSLKLLIQEDSLLQQQWLVKLYRFIQQRSGPKASPLSPQLQLGGEELLKSVQKSKDLRFPTIVVENPEDPWEKRVCLHFRAWIQSQLLSEGVFPSKNQRFQLLCRLDWVQPNLQPKAFLELGRYPLPIVSEGEEKMLFNTLSNSLSASTFLNISNDL